MAVHTSRSDAFGMTRMGLFQHSKTTRQQMVWQRTIISSIPRCSTGWLPSPLTRGDTRKTKIIRRADEISAHR